MSQLNESHPSSAVCNCNALFASFFKVEVDEVVGIMACRFEWTFRCFSWIGGVPVVKPEMEIGIALLLCLFYMLNFCNICLVNCVSVWSREDWDFFLYGEKSALTYFEEHLLSWELNGIVKCVWVIGCQNQTFFYRNFSQIE